MLERRSFEREMATLRTEGPAREHEVIISTGEFGDALARFGRTHDVPDVVFSMLKKSPTYLKIVQTLDAKYLHLHSATIPTSWERDWAPNDAGVFTKGPHAGRRMIVIELSSQGSSFHPYGDPENPVGADRILLLLR